MLSRDTLGTITDCAREFGAGVVWLFGSALGDESTARDIDLAVEGLAPKMFFPFYARLIRDLSKPVDLVDLSLDPPIRHIIWDTGVRIYERQRD
jgi:predicted nucleotidyltransferase